MTRADLLISGRVQGVFYRASAQQEAMRLGLMGEIRNLPDGRVEAAVEGPKERIEEFIEWCKRGPPAAEVEHVGVRWSAARGSISLISTAMRLAFTTTVPRAIGKLFTRICTSSSSEASSSMMAPRPSRNA